MTNLEVKLKAFDIVKKFESKNKRKISVVENEDYDILSKGNDEERHIKVKGTSLTKLSIRYLSKREIETLKNDENAYLYLLSNVFEKPILSVLTGKELFNNPQNPPVELTIFSFRKEI